MKGHANHTMTPWSRAWPDDDRLTRRCTRCGLVEYRNPNRPKALRQPPVTAWEKKKQANDARFAKAARGHGSPLHRAAVEAGLAAIKPESDLAKRRDGSRNLPPSRRQPVAEFTPRLLRQTPAARQRDYENRGVPIVQAQR